MAVQRLYVLKCDADRCNVTGAIVDTNPDARKVGNARGIRRVKIGTYTRDGRPAGPYQRSDVVNRDLCTSHNNPADIEAIRTAVSANRAKYGYYPIGEGPAAEGTVE